MTRRLTGDDYEGLHRRYARLLEGMPELETLAAPSDEIRRRLSSLFTGMMKSLFNEKGSQFRVELVADPAVQRFVSTHASVLDSTFEKVGMSDAMRRRLTRSNYIFSGMKAFHELHEAFPSLLDDNGNRKSFERFLNDVQSIDATYNANYLRAEYNFVAASAEMAARWEQFMADGDRYNLQYRTQADDKVRPEHAALDRVTLPPSDSFWEQFYPPNGWNCRCTVVQVRKSKYPVTPHDEAMRLGDEALRRDSKGIFRFNPGIERKSVPDYNPYTIRRCSTCPIAKGGKSKNLAAFIPDNEVCKACDIIHKMKAEEATRRLTKEERLEIAAATNKWADKHLPRIAMPDGTKAARLTVGLENGDELFIGKKFFSETFAKSKNSRRLAETMQLSTRINEWISSARYVRTETGRHHDFDFRVYEIEVDNMVIELKAKVTEGYIAYLMRLL